MKKIEFTDSELKFIIEQYTNNIMTTQQLGNLFHCSRATIERRLKESGLQLKAKFKYEDLTGKRFGKLIVVKENKERYAQDLLKTKKPHRYWWCQCDCGNPELIQVESSHLKDGHTTSCGCIRSKAEEKIMNLLKTSHIPFKREYTFDNLKGINNGIVRYDFAIFNYDDQLLYLIEYHGQQHYRKTGGWNTPQEFQIRQKNDKIKQEYAKNHNIPLIIIPYTIKPENIELSHLLLRRGENENLA